MLQLLMHHVGRTDLTGIRNCHIPGLHSIMLHDQEGNRVRLYVTQNIDTYANYVRSNQSMIQDDEDMSDPVEIELERAACHRHMNLGFHGHRTEVRLHALTGMLHNITAVIESTEDDEELQGQLRKYQYISPIVNPEEAGIFIQPERFRVVDTEVKALTKDQYVILPATTLHTVHCDNNTSWLVYERGASNNEAVSEFYSYNPHVLPPSSEMYQPMSSDECAVLIARVIALYNQEQQSEATLRTAQEEQQKADEALAEIREAMSEGADTIVPSLISTSTQLRLFKKAVGHDKSLVVSQMSGAITDTMYSEWCAYVRLPHRRFSSVDYIAAWWADKMGRHVRLNSVNSNAGLAIPAQPPAPVGYETYEDRVRRRAQEAIAATLLSPTDSRFMSYSNTTGMRGSAI